MILRNPLITNCSRISEEMKYRDMIVGNRYDTKNPYFDFEGEEITNAAKRLNNKITSGLTIFHHF